MKNFAMNKSNISLSVVFEATVFSIFSISYKL